MYTQQVGKYIPIIRQFMKDKPVDRAWLFGSCSRGEETADSDIDILVEYTEGKTITLFTISDLRVGLRKLLNRPVDIVEDGHLLPFAIPSANHDKILIYERKAQR